MLILFGITAVIATFLGGLFALKFKDKLHLILGFSAGAVIGVAFFDLLPESIKLSHARADVSVTTSIIALGFVLYMILDRTIIFHSHHQDEIPDLHQRGFLGAGSLSIHSFLDGFGIGVGFQISPSVGYIMAIAVCVHDFSDGINTVNLIVKNHGTRSEAFKWLAVDAIAPLLGIISTLFFSFSELFLGTTIAVFCGFFIYIGASDLLPESHHSHPKILTTIMTVLGVVVLYLAIKLSGI